MPEAHAAAPDAASSRPGRTATKRVQLSRGDDQRRGQPEHVRPGGVDDEPGVQGGVGDGGGDRLGQGDRPEQAATAYAGDQRMLAGRRTASTRCSPIARARASRSSRSITAITASPAIAATGLPPKVLP